MSLKVFNTSSFSFASSVASHRVCTSLHRDDCVRGAWLRSGEGGAQISHMLDFDGRFHESAYWSLRADVGLPSCLFQHRPNATKQKRDEKSLFEGDTSRQAPLSDPP